MQIIVVHKQTEAYGQEYSGFAHKEISVSNLIEDRKNLEASNFSKREMKVLSDNGVRLNFRLKQERYYKQALNSKSLKVLDFESLSRRWRLRIDRLRRSIEDINELQPSTMLEQFKGLPDSGSTIDPIELITPKINRLCDLDIKSIVSFDDSQEDSISSLTIPSAKIEQSFILLDFFNPQENEPVQSIVTLQFDRSGKIKICPKACVGRGIKD